MTARRNGLFVGSMFAAAVATITSAASLGAGPAGGNVPEWFRDPAVPAPAAAQPAPHAAPAQPTMVAQVPPAGGPGTAPAAPAPAQPALPPLPPADPNGAAPGALPPPAGDPAAAVPPQAGQPGQPGRPQFPRYPVPGTFAPMGVYGNPYLYGNFSYGPSDYPAGQLQGYVGAAARAATARAIYRRAQRELDGAIRDVQRRFEGSPEMREAVAAERRAYEDLNAARREALRSLTSDEEYQRLSALRQDLAERIQEGRERKTLAADEILAMAKVKMDHAKDLREREADALNARPAVREAQERLVTAGSRVAGLRARHEEAMRDDPQLLIARRNLEDANIANLTAQSYLRNSLIAGQAALNAYYHARTPYQGYYPHGNVYDYYGYGGGYGGYGYGYGVRY